MLQFDVNTSGILVLTVTLTNFTVVSCARFNSTDPTTGSPSIQSGKFSADFDLLVTRRINHSGSPFFFLIPYTWVERRGARARETVAS